MVETRKPREKTTITRVSRVANFLAQQIGMCDNLEDMEVMSNCLRMLIAYEQIKLYKAIIEAEQSQDDHI